MENGENFVSTCLEMHLYCARLMMENALFLEACQTPRECNVIETANGYKVNFEEILDQAICLSNNNISADSLKCEKFITKYTYQAETKTEALTGICINRNLTVRTAELEPENCACNDNLACQVSALNEKCYCLLQKFYNFQRRILDNVIRGNLFVMLQPTFLNTMLQETQLYFANLKCLSNCNNMNASKEISTYANIMRNNCAAIVNMTDPSECQILAQSRELQSRYECLCDKLKSGLNCEILQELLCETIKMRDFVRLITNEILKSRIKSTMLPLFSDHLQRECNYYIKFLNCAK